MKSAVECFQRAAACERAAHDANDEIREMLLRAAKYWRTLGEHAKEREASEAQDGQLRPLV